MICGDCRDVLRAIPAECMHLAITSPPYNVGLEYDGHNDKMPHELYLEWLMAVWSELKRVLVHGGRSSRFILRAKNRKRSKISPAAADQLFDWRHRQKPLE